MSDGEIDPVILQVFNECVDDDAILEVISFVILICCVCGRKRKRLEFESSYSILDRIPTQVKRLHRLIGVTDADCISNLRMDRNTFGRLVVMLREIGGLVDGKYVSVEEQVATFIGILAHHKKNRVVGFDNWRSGQTVSKYVHAVLKSILMLHGLLIAKPEPVSIDSTDRRWKWFKGCLGALDGTYINVKVSGIDKPRFRNRKGEISTNTLGVCDRDLRFVYVFPGWEGSAANSRVLRDAMNRPGGFKVPRGCYYLADSGYANSEGFLTPYRSVRYHLKEWGPENQQPANPREMFNMRHAKARNAIERAFGILKMRWGILRSAFFYPIKIQIYMIAACFLLHNFIRTNMDHDPVEDALDAANMEGVEGGLEDEAQFINNVHTSTEWNSFRDEMATSMWNARFSDVP